MLTEFEMSYEALLDKIGQPTSWFRESVTCSNEQREKYILEQMQSKYPGKYSLEEYYSPNTMSFRYRLKFDSEADEMWFKLKYG